MLVGMAFGHPLVTAASNESGSMTPNNNKPAFVGGLATKTSGDLAVQAKI